MRENDGHFILIQKEDTLQSMQYDSHFNTNPPGSDFLGEDKNKKYCFAGSGLPRPINSYVVQSGAGRRAFEWNCGKN